MNLKASEAPMFSEDAPCCPYCGHVDWDWQDGVMQPLNSEPYACPNCEREYIVSMDVTYTFNAWKVAPLKPLNLTIRRDMGIVEVIRCDTCHSHSVQQFADEPERWHCNSCKGVTETPTKYVTEVTDALRDELAAAAQAVPA